MDDFKLTIKDSSLSFITAFFVSMFLSGLFSILALSILSFFREVDSNGVIEKLITMSITDGLMLLVFLFFNRNKHNHIIKKPSFKKLLIYLGIGILSFFLLSPISNSITYLLIKLGFPSSEFPYDLTNNVNYFISIISYVILPAIAEELLFRGLISRGLKSSGKAFSIVTTSIMFSIFHLSIHQTILPFLMSLLITLIMYNEDNIIYPILIHMINNFLSITLAHFNIATFINHWTYYLVAILLSVAFIILMIYLINKNNNKTNKDKNELIYLYTSIIIILFIWIAYNSMSLIS